MRLQAPPAVLAAVLLGGCASAPQQELAESMEQCPMPRPQVCTMQYDPVCGVFGNGERKQYSNGCSACSDSAVTGYRTGPCE